MRPNSARVTLHRARRALALFLATAIGIAFACSSPPADERFVETTPDPTSFPAVAEMLIQGCGTLDCHGMPTRNLRLYGDVGPRLLPTDIPSTLIATTSDEVAQDYLSVVGLEPEIMSQVVASGGMDPERLTLLAKPLGIESHKGGAVIATGDERYVCLTTWLQGSANATACRAALALP